MVVRATRGLGGALAVLAGVAIAAGCGASSESASLFLTVEVAPGTAAPDELRVSVFDERQAIFVDQRLPATGALTPLSATTLGTVTIYLLPASRAVRLDVRGLSAGQAHLCWTTSVPIVVRRGQQAVTASLSAADPGPDGDGDGVPDAIDNCPRWDNADQADGNGDGLGDACATGGGASRGDGGNGAQTDQA